MVKALLTGFPLLSRRSAGFTLMELSIALVIIGVITGGILVGRDMIRSTQIKLIAEQRDRYKNGVLQFRERFDALPGDFRNAVSLWGAAHNTPATCRATASTGVETCDGNGDGLIGNTGQEYERFRAWQHLVNAEIIEGRFNGVSQTPEMPIPGHWQMRWFGEVSSGATLFYGKYNHALYTDGNALTPNELWAIDDKFDDGKPAQGIIATRPATGLNCTRNAANTAEGAAMDANATYNRAIGSYACDFYQLDFIGR